MTDELTLMMTGVDSGIAEAIDPHDELMRHAVIRDGKVMVALRYVGAKPSKRDTVAGSNVIWEGPGAVREVALEVAKKLLLYPDVWALPEVPWVAPVIPVDQADLLALIEAGDWGGVKTRAPDLFATAQQWFRAQVAEKQEEPSDLARAKDKRPMPPKMTTAHDAA
jgi:hypothetical protein